MKNICGLQNLCSQSLARLTAESVAAIAVDMREMAPVLKEEALNGGMPLADIYGVRFAKKPEMFKFLEGEIMCLLDLAEIIRAHGIRNFIRQNKKLVKKVSHKLSDSTSHHIDPTDVENADEEAEIHGNRLQQKILLYFASL